MWIRKDHFWKPIRIWIVGASICATIYLSLAAYYDFWVMKVYENKATNYEDTTYFGLWNKCRDWRLADINGTKQAMLHTCTTFDQGTLLGVSEAPGEYILAISQYYLFNAYSTLTSLILEAVW